MAEQRGRAPRGDRGGGIGGLVGAGPSVVGVSGAMRARDVSRPTDEQVADAETKVVIRRRVLDTPLPPLPGGRGRSRGTSAPPAPPAD